MFDQQISGARAAFEELGPTRRLICSTQHAQPKKRTVPAAIGRLIAELGLRYRPAAAADLQAHAEALRLLASDLADIPPPRLERAIDTWVRQERWMPRASELVALVMDQLARETVVEHDARSDTEVAQAFCDVRNAALAEEAQGNPKARRDIEWIVEAAFPRLRHKQTTTQITEPVPLVDVDRLNSALDRYTAPFRYNARGFSYDVDRRGEVA